MQYYAVLIYETFIVWSANTMLPPYLLSDNMLDNEHQWAKIQEVLPESSLAQKHNHGLKNDHYPGSVAVLDLAAISALADELFCHYVERFLPGRYL